MDAWTGVIAALLGAIVAGMITYGLERQRAKEHRQRELRNMQIEDVRTLQDTVAQLVLDADVDYSVVSKNLNAPGEEVELHRQRAVETYTRAEVLVSRISEQSIQRAWRDVNIHYSLARMNLGFASSIGDLGVDARGVWVIEGEPQGETKSAGQYLADAAENITRMRAAYRKFNDAVKEFLKILDASS